MHSFHISKRQFSLALMCSLGAPRLWSSSSAAATAGSNITDIISSKQPMADYTEVFEAAILKQHRNRLGDLYVPAGVWPLRTLTLRDSVRLRGAGRNATILKALPSDAPGFITLATGPVRSSGLSNLSLDGGSPDKATNPNQWAISLISRAEQQAEIPNGGLWSSEFDGITIYNFSRGIELVGDRTRKYMLPHQFLSFRNIVSQLSKDLVGPILRVAGQVDQVMFQQCLFDHWKRSLTKDLSYRVRPCALNLEKLAERICPSLFILTSAPFNLVDRRSKSRWRKTSCLRAAGSKSLPKGLSLPKMASAFRSWTVVSPMRRPRERPCSSPLARAAEFRETFLLVNELANRLSWKVERTFPLTPIGWSGAPENNGARN